MAVQKVVNSVVSLVVMKVVERAALMAVVETEELSTYKGKN